MTELNNREYYINRAAKAESMVRSAASPYIAEIHQKLADNYRELANLAEDAPPMLHVVNG